MMTTEQQNKIWACLSKDAREELKSLYRDFLRWEDSPANILELDKRLYVYGGKKVLENIFNKENLTSEIEPRFKKDETVRSISTNKVLKIYGNCADIEKSSCLCVCQDGSIQYFPIRDLEPYTEPETKNNMEEKKLNLDLENKCEKERKLFAEIKIYL